MRNPKTTTSDASQDEADDSEEMVDITAILDSAAASLDYANPLLCNPDSFNLQDSMAALELMDPKMDCCEIPTVGGGDPKPKPPSGSSDPPRASTVPPRNLPRGLDDGLSPLPWDDLTLCDARLIVLEATTRLESMLSGSSVAESTYTCLYAHDAVLVDMAGRLGASSSTKPAAAAAARRTVYASALLLVKLGEAVRTVVQHADIYEEEDFTVNAYGFRFCPGVDDDDLRAVVNSATKSLNGVAAGATASEQEKADANLAGLILGFQLDLLEACSFLTKLSAKNIRAVVGRVKKIVSSGLEKLEKVKVALSERNDEKEALALETPGTDVLARSFDSFINRRLLGNAPVRKVKFQKPVDSLATLTKVMAELDWATCDLLLHGSTLARIKRMLAHISTSSVNILSRSLIVLNLYFDDLLLGQHNLGQVIAQHMQQIGGAPPSLTETEYGRSFLNRLGKPVYDTLKMLALNRNRQRAYADALMIREWAALKVEATAVDYYFRQENGQDSRAIPLATNYVLYTTVWLMEHHLGIGIELGLFPGHHDLAIAFWYWDFLLSTQLNIATVMRKAKVERKLIEAQMQREQEEKKAATENQARGKKKGKKAAAANSSRSAGVSSAASSLLAPSKEEMEDNIEYMFLGLRRTLCRGIVRFIAALNQAEVLHVPKYLFTSHEIRFCKRFESFAVIEQPPPLSYKDFEKGSDYSGMKPEELLLSAAECFKATKAVVDKLLGHLSEVEMHYLPIRKVEVMKLAKVCVGNSIYLHKLTEHVKNAERAKIDVTFDFEAHKQFCSIKIK